MDLLLKMGSKYGRKTCQLARQPAATNVHFEHSQKNLQLSRFARESILSHEAVFQLTVKLKPNEWEFDADKSKTNAVREGK